jgi:hypothetical protein
VRLGVLTTGGLAPAILAIVERGVLLRPGPARLLVCEIELRLEDPFPPVRVLFGGEYVLVEDGPGHAPDLRITGRLPDLISLLVAPQVGGVPLPFGGRGRAAVLAFGRVRIEGRLGLLRRVLSVIRLQ